MNGGKISGNTSPSSSISGSGVYISGDGAFIMSDGEISDNAGDSGVFVGSKYTGVRDGGYPDKAGVFTMRGGKISGNTAISYGGGVCVAGGGNTLTSGTFTMENGEISGNTASNGGGVSTGGTFTMNGGAISGNTASDYGGGVYVLPGTFIKQLGAVIYGSNASNALKNTASSNSSGHAVSGYQITRNTTAGTDIILDSMKSGAAGGWE
jgi:hypothetical protein